MVLSRRLRVNDIHVEFSTGFMVIGFNLLILIVSIIILKPMVAIFFLLFDAVVIIITDVLSGQHLFTEQRYLPE